MIYALCLLDLGFVSCRVSIMVSGVHWFCYFAFLPFYLNSFFQFHLSVVGDGASDIQVPHRDQRDCIRTQGWCGIHLSDHGGCGQSHTLPPLFVLERSRSSRTGSLKRRLLPTALFHMKQKGSGESKSVNKFVVQIQRNWQDCCDYQARREILLLKGSKASCP